MRIALCSDLHLEFGGPIPNLIADADVLVLAGDICEAKKMHQFVDLLQQVSNHYTAVIMVAGNHEAYRGEFTKSKNTIRALVEPFGNIYFLDKELVTIDGVVFGGCTLWSYISPMQEWFAARGMNDYHLITNQTRTGYRKLRPSDTVFDHSQSVIWIIQQNPKIDVMVTHHAPSLRSIAPEYQRHDLNCCYATDLEYLMPNKQVWIHGHMHNAFDYTVDGCRVLCNPRGYHGHEAIAQTFSVQVVEIKKHLLNGQN